MPPRTRALPTVDERTRDILEATLHLVAEGGVDAVRYREVAAAAGVPLGTVSYHYASRQELLRAAFTHFLEENTRALMALRARFTAERLGLATPLAAARTVSEIFRGFQLVRLGRRDGDDLTDLRRRLRAFLNQRKKGTTHASRRSPR